MHGVFLLNQKLLKILNHVFKRYLKNENLHIFSQIKKVAFFQKKC